MRITEQICVLLDSLKILISLIIIITCSAAVRTLRCSWHGSTVGGYITQKNCQKSLGRTIFLHPSTHCNDFQHFLSPFSQIWCILIAVQNIQLQCWQKTYETLRKTLHSTAERKYNAFCNNFISVKPASVFHMALFLYLLAVAENVNHNFHCVCFILKLEPADFIICLM